MNRFGLNVAAVIIALVGLCSAALAQTDAKTQEMIRICKPDLDKYCGGANANISTLTQCLANRLEQISKECGAALAQPTTKMQQTPDGPKEEKAKQKVAEDAPAEVQVLRDLAYGADLKQKLDIYVPKGATNAPVIVMMHGGVWSYGSKTDWDTVKNKVAYWLPKGFIFVSVDTRLMPEADPLKQADDLAAALAYTQKRVGPLGGNPDRLVLMGHSAGAMLSALLTADPSIAIRAGAKPWRASVLLDSGAYNVEWVMEAEPPELFVNAFTRDRAYWKQASPAARLTGTPVPVFMVCALRRAKPCEQTYGFAERLKAARGTVKVLPVDLDHVGVNSALGLPGDYTEQVAAFIDEAVRAAPSEATR